MFKELEKDFRGWINQRMQRGSVQEYEEKIMKKLKWKENLNLKEK